MSRSRGPDAENPESRAAITEFLYVKHDPAPVDLCFVLGCPTATNMDPAIALYRRGWTPTIMISGHGPSPQDVPEASQFVAYAVDRGVPESVMLTEKSATNTLENFTLSAPIIEREIGWKNIRRVALVCKPFHARRVLMTAQQHWPKRLHYIVLPSQRPSDLPAETWWNTQWGRDYIFRELVAIGTYAQKRDIGDV